MFVFLLCLHKSIDLYTFHQIIYKIFFWAYFYPMENNLDELNAAINELENIMERWHLARDADWVTLEKINALLVGLGRLSWFNDGSTP